MQKINFFKIRFIILVCTNIILTNNILADNKNNIFSFTKSFVNSYDLSGRYTHEYHPFILEKTRKSFLELEQAIKDDNINIAGHIGILGYQEEAVVPYRTDWSRFAIADETIVKTDAGISEPARNIFGFMTGFLLKDSQWLENRWFKDSAKPLISHIGQENIELFNDDAYIFQKDSFGKEFENLLGYRNLIESALYKRDLKSIFSNLINIWQDLYKNASTTNTNEILGTQDINFSIDYAKALVESKSNIERLYVGPDITYPIEVLSCQNEQTTRHAQEFIEKFQEELIARDNEPTAYIFCSFVDGVGKSTLLNNIKNYQLHKNSYNDYTRGDNSSSQEAQLYQLKDKVFLVDLPAQMSHFAIKPDGEVFVDIETTGLSSQDKDAISEKINSDGILLLAEFKSILKNLEDLNLERTESLYPESRPLESNKIIEQYAKNCLALGINNPSWIPGEINGNIFIFNKNKLQEIRVLTPLSEVHSFGLKVVEPEQMLFNKGLALPMDYNIFLKDLKAKLASVNTKHVVFVDFLSMYPRTSRETVRINFLLQYLKQVFGAKYDIQNSPYKHMVHREQEICHLLNTKEEKVSDLLMFETALRWALYDLLENHLESTLSYCSGAKLERLLNLKIQNYLAAYEFEILDLIRARFHSEKEFYWNNYGLDKIYQTLVACSNRELENFSNTIIKILQNISERNVSGPNSIWSGMAGNLVETSLFSRKFILENFDNNTVNLSLRAQIAAENKEKKSIGPVRRMLRAQWLAALTKILLPVFEEQDLSKKSVPNSNFNSNLAGITKVAALPILVKSSENYKNLLVLQRELEFVSKYELKDYKFTFPKLYHIARTESINLGKFPGDENLYYINWHNNLGTHFGIYEYGYFPIATESENWPRSNIITAIVSEYRILNSVDGNINRVINTAKLYNLIENKNIINTIKADINNQVKDKIIISQQDPKIEYIRLWARLTATMLSIVKDPDSDIIVQEDNQEDFIACIKLLELITLPLYYNIEIEGQLFADDSDLKPLYNLED